VQVFVLSTGIKVCGRECSAAFVHVCSVTVSPRGSGVSVDCGIPV
jgi:hypothetical protein